MGNVGVDVLHVDFARSDPDAFARILARGDIDEINSVLQRLSATVAASVVSRLPVPLIEGLLDCNEDAVKTWLCDTPIDTAIALLSQIPREISLALVNSLGDRVRRRRFLQYLHYPAHSVGALVTDVPLEFQAEMPAKAALVELRKLGGEDPGPVVVVLADASYLGLLDKWKLLTNHPVTGPIRNYVLVAPPLHAETPVASAISDPSWHEHNWLPVVDHERRILGGVSRARLFGAMGHGASEHARGSLFTLLLSEIPYVAGQLVSRAWVRRKAS